MIQCPHPLARIEWDRLIEELQGWMRKVDTHPAIRAGISQVLWNYGGAGSNIETFIPPQIEASVRRCFTRQSRLGWTQFLQGILSHSWAKTQDEYYKSRGSRKQGRRWAVNLSKQLWRMVFGMWDHRNTEMFTDRVNALSGEDQMKQAIRRELHRGLGNLSPIYSNYFRTNTKTLFGKPVRVMKQWLVVIRRGRIAQGYRYEDEIGASIEIQEWIGLITKDEANRL